MNLSTSEFLWFEDSPDALDPNCICSFCEEPINPPRTGIEHDIRIPIRLFHPNGKEARFHIECLRRITA